MNETKAGEDTAVGRLAQDFKTVMNDAEGLIKATAGEVGEKVREARGRLAASLETAKTGYHKIEAKAIEGAKATDKVIREHPYESIGVAFGVGLLIGVLVTRR
jgi:ElaB/YqjD/DUF883 family membrane-anchored ribosome-binding protein